MEPFATSNDLENRYPVDYRDASSEERATYLLAHASRIVRHRIPGIDSRTDLDIELVKDVVCEMVWFAVHPGVVPGATSVSQSVGGVSLSTSFEGASGRLRLTREQLRQLRPARASARAGSVSNLPPAYGRTPASETPVGWPYA